MTGRRLVVEADGGSRGNPGPAGYGAVVRDAASGEVLREVAAGIGRATNNVAEYEGLLAGLRAALELDPAQVVVRMDSKLVVEQMCGRWQVKHPDMRVLAQHAFDLVRRLPAVTFRHIPRAQNSHADRLANEAMDAAARGESWSPPAPVPAATQISAAQVSTAQISTVQISAVQISAAQITGPPTVTVCLRHGATPLTADKRFSGLGEADLSPVGLTQAQAAAERLAGEPAYDVLLASPLRRTAHTAEIVGARLGLAVVEEGRLRETDFGDWEGFTFAEVGERWPAELATWLASQEVAPPGGESFAATGRRVRQARDRIVSSYAGQRVLVVSHVTPIKTLVRMALDAPAASLHRMQLDPVGLTEIDWHPDGPAVLRRFNDAAHLP